MQVREVIELLAKIFEENGTFCVQAETFRAAKFNNDGAVLPLWKLLFQLLYFSKFGVLSESVLKSSDDIATEQLVGQVKRELQQRGYLCKRLASLPESGTTGSRELLLALAWLLAKASIIDRFIDQRASPLDENYMDWVTGSVPKPKPAFSQSSSGSAVDRVQRLLLLNGKLRMNLRQLHSLQQQEAKLTFRVHESTRGVSLVPDQPHLSVLEVHLLRHAPMMRKMLKLLEDDNTRLQHLLLFKEQEKVFWKWMESVLELRNQEMMEMRLTDNGGGEGRPPCVYLPVAASCRQQIQSARQQLLEAILKYETVIARLEELWLSKKSDVSKYELDRLLAAIMAEISSHQAHLSLSGLECPRSPPKSSPRLMFQTVKPRDNHRALRIAGGRPSDQSIADGQGVMGPLDMGQMILQLEEEVRQLELELRQRQISGRDRMLALAAAIPSGVCIEPMALHRLGAQLQ